MSVSNQQQFAAIEKRQDINLRHSIAEVSAGQRRALARILDLAKLDVAESNWLKETILERHLSELRSLRNAAKRRDRRSVYNNVRRILGSSAGKISAILRVVAEKNFEGLPATGVTRLNLEEAATRLDLFVPLKGVAKLHLLGGVAKLRPVWDFSGIPRAAHKLIDDVLCATGVRSAIDCNTKGKGRESAASSIRSLIESGYEHWIIFDIKNFYPTVTPSHLKWLPLPSKVITSSVYCSQHMHVCGTHEEGALKAARLGLPQGAITSGKIASRLIERELLSVIGEEDWVVSYVDDVAIGARSPAEMDRIASAITSRFKHHPAGPLQFKTFTVVEASHGFSFLNYRFRLEADGEMARCHVHPDRSAYRNFEHGIYRRLDAAGCSDFDEKCAIAGDYLARWIKSHPAWTMTQDSVDLTANCALQYVQNYGTISQFHHTPLLEKISRGEFEPPSETGAF